MNYLDLDHSKKYLLACSYGPDSMALFKMLLNEGYYFEVAHVNYNLREESKEETTKLIDFCKENNVKIHKKEIYNWKTKTNLEAQCREIRYSFFARLVNQYKYDSVLVAHNEDDSIETYLLQKKRCTLVSYYGLNNSTLINGVNILRPLLKWKKSELQKYCDFNKVPYAIDKSNLSNIYERNKIRHSIVERLSDDERKEYLSMIENENKSLGKIYLKIGSLDLRCCDSYKNLNDIEMAYALNSISEKPISKKTVLQIKKVLESEKPNVEVPITRGYFFLKEYDLCYFGKRKNVSYSFVLEKPCKIDNEILFFDGLSDTSNRNIKFSDYPIVIRTYRKNDYYTIKNYKCSVSRLFIDWKMPLSFRKRWPVFVNCKNEIIYIPRYRSDFDESLETNLKVKHFIYNK